jgi:hypothetical protein
MNIHKNARLTPFGRERLVRMTLGGQTRPVETGWSVSLPKTLSNQIPKLERHLRPANQRLRLCSINRSRSPE